MPFSLPSPFSITRFNFFCLQVLLTTASLLALAKSIDYLVLTPLVEENLSHNLVPSSFPEHFPSNLGRPGKAPPTYQEGTDALDASVQEKTEKSQQLLQIPLAQTDSSKEKPDLDQEQRTRN